MNLYDIVKRRDRALDVISGSVEAVRSDTGGYFGAKLAPRTAITLRNAHEFKCLEERPPSLGWTGVGSRSNQRPFETAGRSIELRVPEPSILWSSGKPDANDFLLRWPPQIAGEVPFDLVIANDADEVFEIASTPIFDPRLPLRSLMRGKGIEVGPGGNPQVNPSPAVDVQYVEIMHPSQWVANYAKSGSAPDRSLWDRYIIGDAHHLENCADASLDFIFSNHVFEHLMNPLGVLENWSRKLRPGGVIIGVTPDQRFCFDLRQPPSVAADWLREYENSVWTPPVEKYERWCRFTEPRATPENLIARNYSIHTHYYRPDTFRSLAELARARGICDKIELHTSRNAKDFSFVLSRPA